MTLAWSRRGWRAARQTSSRRWVGALSQLPIRNISTARVRRLLAAREVAVLAEAPFAHGERALLHGVEPGAFSPRRLSRDRRLLHRPSDPKVVGKAAAKEAARRTERDQQPLGPRLLQ